MKQKTVLNILKSGKNVFITGSAGTGKTYLLNQYIQYLKKRGIYPTIVAPTGIAASHLKGQTIHSFFALGIRDGVVDNGYINILLKKKYLRSRFEKLQVLIIDEVSMVSPEMFSSMDRILCAFKKSAEAFGGVQVVISGDFFQLPPVSRELKEKRFAWQSHAWKALELQSCYLQEKFRQEDNRLIQILDDIRLGSVSENSYNLLNSRLNAKLDIDFKPTKLYTHNFDVDRINLDELKELKGKSHIYHYTSKGEEKSIDKIFKTALVVKILELKKDAVVIFIKNNPEQEYINGTTGVVVGFEGNTPIVKTTEGKLIKVVSEDWILENDEGENLATVSQIPLRLAWAITIHKSQGMTLDSAQIDLSKTFEVGQGYVALSRLKNIDGLSLLGINEMALRVEPLTLRIDEPIQKASIRATKEIEDYSKEELEKIHFDYIEFLSGVNIKSSSITSIDRELDIDINSLCVDFIEEDKTKDIELLPSKKKKSKNKNKTKNKIKYTDLPTHVQTKLLIDSCNSIAEIANIRGLKNATIIGHLRKIKKDDKNINLQKFKPTGKFVKVIKKAILKLQKSKDENIFDKNGLLKSHIVVRELEGKYSYDEVQLVLLFIE